MSATRGGGSASLDMADFPGSDDRGAPLNGSQSAFGVNGRALDAPAAELAALFAAEGERAVAYLCTSARPMTFADADALVERAFAQARERWPDSRRFSRPAIFTFVTLQQELSAHRPSGADQSADAVAQATAAAANRPDLPRLVALQNALDQLPPQQRQAVVLRELSRFTPAETGEVLQLQEPAVESARMDALRALIWTLDRGTPTGAPGSYQLAPEDFAGLARLLDRGDRRRADAERRFVALLAPASPESPQAAPAAPQAPVAAPLEPYRPVPPTFSAPRSGPINLGQAPVPQPPAPVQPTYQPTYQPPAQPVYESPAQPTYQPPAQPVYESPAQPTYQPPVQPMYQAPAALLYEPPAQPSYQAPAQPPLSFEPPATQAFVAQQPPGQSSYPSSTLPTPTSFPPSAPPSSFPSHAPSPPVRMDELGEWRPTAADLAGGGGPRSSTPIFDEISAWFSAAPAAPPPSAVSSGGLQVVDLRSGASDRVGRWDALHDDGWLAANERAAATPQIAGSTDAGLPRRRPGANQPPSAADSAVRPTVPARDLAGPDANDVRRRLDGFQQGLRTARQTRSHVQEPSRSHGRSHAATDRRSADDTKEIVFGAFYNGYLPHLLAQLMGHGARPAVAAEVAQDAMAAAYQAWEQIPAPEEWTRNWALNAFTNPTASGTRPWEAPPATGAPAPESGSLFDSGH